MVLSPSINELNILEGRPSCYAKLPTANTRSNQLHWGDGEMGTAISCSQMVH